MSHTENAIFINAKECKIEVVEIKNLDDARKLVEGYLEHVLVDADNRTGLYVNEEGQLKQFPYGFQLMGRTFVGNGFICDHDADGNFVPLQLHPELAVTELGLKWMKRL